MSRALMFVACFLWACGEEASPLLDQRGTGAPVVPWVLPIPAPAATLNGTAGRSADAASSPDGAWFLVKSAQVSDVVEDAARERFYLSSLNGQVARYDMRDQALIGSWDLGGELLGMDVSPDGNTLLVADRSGSAPCLHRVDLSNEEAQKIDLPLAESGGGATLDVAFIDDSQVLVALKNARGPDLVLLNLADASVRVVHWGSSESTLISSPDRSRIAFAINGARSTVGRYLAAEERFEELPVEGRILALAIHPRVDQLAVATTASLTLLDAQLRPGGSFGSALSAPAGVAYIANGEQLAIAWPNISALLGDSTQAPLEAYDLQTHERIAALDTTHLFASPTAPTGGQLKTSRDGRWLFAKSGGGVVVHKLVNN